MGTQQNDFNEIRMKIGRKIKQVFGDRSGCLEFFDIVEEAGHWAFKIRFVAYNYFVIVFNYELDIIGFSIEAGQENKICIMDEHTCYSNTDLDSYIKKVIDEIELRIPDKYLRAHGWI